MDISDPVPVPESLQPAVDSLLLEGKSIPAVKLVRERTGLSLTDATLLVRRRLLDLTGSSKL